MAAGIKEKKCAITAYTALERFVRILASLLAPRQMAL